MKDLNISAVVDHSLAALEQLPPDVRALIKMSGLDVMRTATGWRILQHFYENGVRGMYHIREFSSWDWDMTGKQVPYTKWQYELNLALEKVTAP